MSSGPMEPCWTILAMTPTRAVTAPQKRLDLRKCLAEEVVSGVDGVGVDVVMVAIS